MKCQFCSNPATYHLTTLVNETEKKHVHLCEACAKQQQIVPEPHEPLNIPAIVHALLGPHLSPVSEELARLTCPECGIKYMEFRGDGRLGCPHDYDVFRPGLEPILKRVHRAVRHTGKQPPHHLHNRQRQAEMLHLHQRLRQAIVGENFEEAARLRDSIREKEAADDSAIG
jgi:protein arginine kinase activator